jgi:hypothetical protein
MRQCCCLPLPTLENVQAGLEARELACRATDRKSVIAGEAKKDCLKLSELSRNVYENKGQQYI